MKLKLIFILFIFLISFSFSAVYADVIEPGKKTIPISYVIENINDYQDYIVLLHGNPSPDYIILNSSSFNFYKLSDTSIYAVSKSQFNESDLQGKNQSSLDSYFKNNSQVINSSLKLDGIYKSVGTYDPLSNVTIVLRIKSINPSGMEIEKSKIIFQYSDGSTIEKPFPNQNSTPNNPSQPAGILSYWYYILPILAALAILIIILVRKYR
jgi:hypothetical protein